MADQNIQIEKYKTSTSLRRLVRGLGPTVLEPLGSNPAILF